MESVNFMINKNTKSTDFKMVSIDNQMLFPLDGCRWFYSYTI